MPVPPSDFCCTAIADPKARFVARRLPIDIHQPETRPSYPADPRALNFASIPLPRLLGPAEGAEYVPLTLFNQDAPCVVFAQIA